ncbi:hypothetical protein PHYC_00538 [Phycisphaerales bacterium]|nr:hypothetical protein PHYC_00538 [Phycisphaerales bacterium]
MQIRLIDGRIATTPGMLEFVHTRLAAAVGRFASRLREVRVRIVDVNGPKGGLDKRCVILATVNGRGKGGGSVVIARECAAGFYAAIAGASHTLKRLVTRYMESHSRSRTFPRSRRGPRERR